MWNMVVVSVRHLAQLHEADVLVVLPEPLAAHVQTVLVDQAVSVGAGPALASSELKPEKARHI